MGRFALDTRKLRDAVCFVVSSVEPDDLGAVKLQKVLYYADMLSYLRSGRPLTGAIYKKRPFGPTSDALLSTLRRLDADGVIAIAEQDYFGYRKKTFTLAAGCNFPSLTSDEADLLREMIDFVCRSNTAKSISDFSHDIVWQMVDFGQDIPYSSALNWLPSQPSEEALVEAASVWGQIADQRPVRAAEVESGVPTALRSRLLARAGQPQA